MVPDGIYGVSLMRNPYNRGRRYIERAGELIERKKILISERK
jgi:hypothetical protein